MKYQSIALILMAATVFAQTDGSIVCWGNTLLSLMVFRDVPNFLNLQEYCFAERISAGTRYTGKVHYWNEDGAQQ